MTLIQYYTGILCQWDKIMCTFIYTYLYFIDTKLALTMHLYWLSDSQTNPSYLLLGVCCPHIYPFLKHAKLLRVPTGRRRRHLKIDTTTWLHRILFLKIICQSNLRGRGGWTESFSRTKWPPAGTHPTLGHWEYSCSPVACGAFGTCPSLHMQPFI